MKCSFIFYETFMSELYNTLLFFCLAVNFVFIVSHSMIIISCRKLNMLSFTATIYVFILEFYMCENLEMGS